MSHKVVGQRMGLAHEVLIAGLVPYLRNRLRRLCVRSSVYRFVTINNQL